jgi:hypothetical protein
VDNDAMPVDAADPELPRDAASASERVDPAPDASRDAALARRTQILASEHWALLAARGTAQNEVLTRITIFLTLVSAGLVTIGLLGQATGFADSFPAAALCILAFLGIVGVLTEIRVLNVADEDMMFVIAMNRLRGGYVDLDPAVADYFLQAATDDERGMRISYSFLRPRGSGSQVLGSTAFLISLVNACVLGLFAGGLAAVGGAPLGWAIPIGGLAGLLVVAASVFFSYRGYRNSWRHYTPRRTTGESSPSLRRPR